MANKKTILISGGSGRLGSYLKTINPAVLAPAHSEMDILEKESIDLFLEKYKPHIFLHCAAFTGPVQCDSDPMKAMRVNIAGTCNVVESCYEKGIRLVYISTDYVFKGDRGGYGENDELLPQNLYAWTKLGGECAVNGYKNSLIIRTSFSPDIFPYDKAFVDQYTSRDSLAVIAPIILELAEMPDLTGIINVGTERKTVRELALKLGKANVGEISRKDVSFATPYDTSFNLLKLKEILKI